MQTVLDIIRHYSGAGKGACNLNKKQYEAECREFNLRNSAEFRTKAIVDQETVTAQTEWVWTEVAEQNNPHWQRAGEPVWSQWKTQVPKGIYDRGLVMDKSEFVKEGQADLFEFL